MMTDDRPAPRCRGCGKPLDGSVDVVFLQAGGAAHADCAETVRHHAQTVTLMCTLCLIPVVEGEHVIFDGSGLVHAECQARATSGGEVGKFLQAERGRPYCHVCIADRLGLKSNTVRKAVWALRVVASFQVSLGTCAECGAPRIVVSAVDRAASP